MFNVTITPVDDSMLSQGFESMNLTGSAHHKFETSDLDVSICMDLGVLVLGYMLHRIMKFLGIGCQRKGINEFVVTTMAHNYLNFLLTCRDMFMAQALLSFVLMVPNWGLAPLSVGLYGERLNTAHRLSNSGLVILCLETLLRGVVALHFIERLRHRIKMPEFRDSVQLKKTLWLTGLPVYDSASRRPFFFNDADFKQVSDDLQRAIYNDLAKHGMTSLKESDVKIELCPVVDEWNEVSTELQTSLELMLAYAEHCDGIPDNEATSLQSQYYANQLKTYRAKVARLKLEVRRIARDKKRITGSAFVTFTDPKFRDHFLKEKPSCWQFRHYAFFSFGRPPFSSVTLACMRAPHPTDVNWVNLHITQNSQTLRLIGLVTVLTIAMLVIVSPVTVISQLSVILPAFGTRITQVGDVFHTENLALGHGASFWINVCNQVPALLLVAINSLILPECIRVIAEYVRPHKRSSVEIIQMHLNYVFLVLNSMVVPILGLTSITALTVWGERRIGEPFWVIAEDLVTKLMQSSGVFALRYIVNCACITNTNQMLQLPQYAFRVYSRWAAVTPRQFVQAEEEWEYAWGYWYAWALSVFTLGLCISTFVPSTLPLLALFFCIQHLVDGHNLLHGVFAHGAECENSFITRALNYMRCIVATWWFLTSLGFAGLVIHQSETWNSFVPIGMVKVMIGFMMGAAATLAIWSWWDMTAILHDNNFDTVDISKRGLSSGILATLETMLRKACQNYVHIDAEDAVELPQLEEGEVTVTNRRKVRSGGASPEPVNLLTRSEPRGGEWKYKTPKKNVDPDDELTWDAYSVVIQDPEAIEAPTL